MPSDREVQTRRRQALYNIMAEGRQVTEQEEFVQILREMGIPSTQSSISRDLKVMGAVRIRGYYEIPSWLEEEDADHVSPFRKVIPFVRAVKPAGQHMILLVTDQGAGRVVSQAINDSEWDDLIGTVEGYSNVLLLTDGFFFQRLVHERLKYYLGADGENMIIEKE